MFKYLVFFLLFFRSVLFGIFPHFSVYSLEEKQLQLPEKKQQILCFSASAENISSLQEWKEKLLHNRKTSSLPLYGVIVLPPYLNTIISKTAIISYLKARIPKQYVHNIFICFDGFEAFHKKLLLPENTEKQPHLFVLDEKSNIHTYVYGKYTIQKLDLINSFLR